MNRARYEVPRLGAITPTPWERPEIFDLSITNDQVRLEQAFVDGMYTKIIDQMDVVADDLFEYKHPADAGNLSERLEFRQNILEHGAEYGKWVLFPWLGSVVHYPDKADYQAMRTFRNNPLVTDRERDMLLQKHVAVFGLSVGSNVLDRLVQGGIGGKYTIGDPDTVGVTNLNRINATYVEVGQGKLDIIAKRISEIDPYIDQVHYADGVSPGSFKKMEADMPELIIEEVDSMEVMATLRSFAKEHKIPLITGTDIDRAAIIDIEDYRSGTQLFNGRLSPGDIKLLIQGGVSDEQNLELMIKHVGLSNITPRLVEAAKKLGSEIVGIPQLGTTAGLTGVAVASATREVLLGRDMSSGRYVASLDGALKIKRYSPYKITRSIIDLYQLSKADKSS